MAEEDSKSIAIPFVGGVAIGIAAFYLMHIYAGNVLWRYTPKEELAECRLDSECPSGQMCEDGKCIVVT